MVVVVVVVVVLAKRLAGKCIAKMTCFVLSATLNLNSVNQSFIRYSVCLLEERVNINVNVKSVIQSCMFCVIII